MDPRIERLTHKVWPDAPPDYSLATVSTRWEAMEASYRAQRIKEYAEAAGNYEAEAIATATTEPEYEH